MAKMHQNSNSRLPLQRALLSTLLALIYVVGASSQSTITAAAYGSVMTQTLTPPAAARRQPSSGRLPALLLLEKIAWLASSSNSRQRAAVALPNGNRRRLAAEGEHNSSGITSERSLFRMPARTAATDDSSDESPPLLPPLSCRHSRTQMLQLEADFNRSLLQAADDQLLDQVRLAVARQLGLMRPADSPTGQQQEPDTSRVECAASPATTDPEGPLLRLDVFVWLADTTCKAAAGILVQQMKARPAALFSSDPALAAAAVAVWEGPLDDAGWSAKDRVASSTNLVLSYSVINSSSSSSDDGLSPDEAGAGLGISCDPFHALRADKLPVLVALGLTMMAVVMAVVVLVLAQRWAFRRLHEQREEALAAATALATAGALADAQRYLEAGEAAASTRVSRTSGSSSATSSSSSSSITADELEGELAAAADSRSDGLQPRQPPEITSVRLIGD